MNGLRTALVTGGARGLGFCIAGRLLKDGFRVVIADVDAATADDAAKTLGGRAEAFACDVTNEAAVESLIRFCVTSGSELHTLVNNAGVTRDAMLHKMELADFQSVINVHLQGAWLCSRAAMKHMRGQSGGGVIVNVSSISGKVGNAGQTNYSTAKAGLIGLTKATAKEGARRGVRVNAVMPGLIRTPMTELMPESVLKERLAEIPLGRMGEPDEVAEVVAFLVSDRASYLTGIAIEISGGRHM